MGYCGLYAVRTIRIERPQDPNTPLIFGIDHPFEVQLYRPALWCEITLRGVSFQHLAMGTHDHVRTIRDINHTGASFQVNGRAFRATLTITSRGYSNLAGAGFRHSCQGLARCFQPFDQYRAAHALCGPSITKRFFPNYS
jgi:hypothetical protein